MPNRNTTSIYDKNNSRHIMMRTFANIQYIIIGLCVQINDKFAVTQIDKFFVDKIDMITY